MNNTKQTKDNSNINKGGKLMKFRNYLGRRKAYICGCIIVAVLIITTASLMQIYKVNQQNTESLRIKEQKYNQLDKENAQLVKQIDELQQQLEKKDAELESKNEVISKIQNNYTTLNKQIDELIKTIEN